MFNCLCINDLFALQRYKNFWTFLLFSLCFKALSTIYMQVGNFRSKYISTSVEYGIVKTSVILSGYKTFGERLVLNLLSLSRKLTHLFCIIVLSKEKMFSYSFKRTAIFTWAGYAIFLILILGQYILYLF